MVSPVLQPVCVCVLRLGADVQFASYEATRKETITFWGKVLLKELSSVLTCVIAFGRACYALAQ